MFDPDVFTAQLLSDIHLPDPFTQADRRQFIEDCVVRAQVLAGRHIDEHHRFLQAMWQRPALEGNARIEYLEQLRAAQEARHEAEHRAQWARIDELELENEELRAQLLERHRGTS